jgi:hypothetical protein
MVGEASETGCFEAGLTGFADGRAPTLVLVVGGDVADAGVETHAVVVATDHL